MDFKMPNKIDEQLEMVKHNLERMKNDRYNACDSLTENELMLKFIIAETLIDIRHQLFEISHYGIGTD